MIRILLQTAEIPTTQEKNQRNSLSLQRRYLKPTAVPTIFPNAPAYYSSKSTQRPIVISTTEARRHMMESRLKDMEDAVMKSDKISELSINEIKARLEK